MSVKRPAENATKAKILEAFDELQESYGGLEEELQSLQDQLKQQAKELRNAQKAASGEAPSSAPTPSMALAQVMSVTEHSKSKHNKMQIALELLGQLQTGASSTLAELSEKLSVEAHKLQTLLKQSNTEREALKDLYDLEADEASLSKLLDEYDQTAKGSAAEFEQRQEQQQSDWAERQKAWKTEQEQRQQLVRERESSAKTTREREQEEYEYKLALDRQLDEQHYRAEQTELHRARQEAREVQEQEWTERERVLAERERQYWDVMNKADNMKAELEAATKKAENEGLGIGNKQARIKADLQDKEIEGQRRLYEQRVANLQTRLDALHGRVKTLSDQVSASSQQMQNLAVKAIEGAANTSSLSAFKELAMEQAKAQGKGKG